MGHPVKVGGTSSATVRKTDASLTSLKIFRKYIEVRRDAVSGKVQLRADGVTSKECYEQWLQSRKVRPLDPAKAFQKALSSHLGAVDGRQPFSAEEEATVLRVLRRKERWPCFDEAAIKFGTMGYRAKGYHERRTLQRALRGAVREDEEDEDDDSSSEEEEEESIEGDDDTFTSADSATAAPSENNNNKRQRMLAYVPLQTNPLMSSIYEKSRAMFHLLQTFGLGAWYKMLGAMRYAVMSHGALEPGPDEEVRELLESLCEEHPDDLILIMDPLSRSVQERIRFQSPCSVRVLGPITRDVGGLSRDLFLPKYRWAVLSCIIQAWVHPYSEASCFVEGVDARGNTFPATLHVSCHTEIVTVVARAELLRIGHARELNQ